MTTWQPSLLDGGIPAVGGFDRAIRTELADDAWVELVPGFLDGADALFEAVLAAAPWAAHELPMYGQLMPSPRLSARWAAGPHDAALPPVIGEAADALTDRYGHEFTSVGANLYRTGTDSVAWHGDRVLRTKPEAVVAVLTLGATRRFRLRPKGGGASVAFDPAAGDLLVMGGSCQRTWQHSIPKTAKPVGPRISVSFRHAV
ncbi:MAG: alpha-ketoglutarate-dependent dioxygenase AlkB [Acidimicrobiia bacterium]|nr:alpha-ketoglutarate-dependent dioxygenase AlkB [Acidimicrobiia bacterium]